MKKIIFLIMLFFATVVFNVYAEADTLNLNFDSKNQSLQIMAETDNEFGQAVTVVIVPEGTVPSEVEINDSVCVDVFNTGENGVIEGSMILPDNLNSGKYAVQLFPFAGEAECFMYINKTVAASMLSVINAAKTNAEIESVFLADYVKIGIDENIFQCVDSSTLARLFNLYRNSGDYTNFDDFYEDYSLAEVTALIKAGEPLDELLIKYQKYLNIDYKNDYETLSAEAKKCLGNILKTADEHMKLNEHYSVLRMLAIVQTAKDWTKLKEVLVQNENVWSPDKTYFNKLVLKDKVYQGLFDKQKELTTKDILADSFYKISMNLYKQEQGQGNNSGSGSGGGGGSTGVGVGGDKTIVAPIKQTPAATSNGFDDMTSHWAKSAVEKLVDKGIINGYPDNTFCPDAEITRAEFITILIKGFPQNEANKTSFVDVSDGAWYEAYLAQAEKAGIVLGDTQKRAFPNQPVTRQDAAVMLRRVLDIYGVSFGESEEEFLDNDSISEYAKDAVYSLVASDIIKGMGDGTFAPGGKTTRAQAAVLINRAMEKIGGVQ